MDGPSAGCRIYADRAYDHGYTEADWKMWTAAWLNDHDEVRDVPTGTTQ